MPLFQRRRDLAEGREGEGEYIAPAPHRPQMRTSAEARLEIECIWWDYRRKGLSVREIAQRVGKSQSTVRGGLKRAEAHLIRLRVDQKASHEPNCVPLLGCQPWPPRPDPARLEVCPVCKGNVTSPSFVCAWCGNVSKRNERVLEAQFRRAELARLEEERRIEATKPKFKPKVT